MTFDPSEQNLIRSPAHDSLTRLVGCGGDGEGTPLTQLLKNDSMDWRMIKPVDVSSDEYSTQ